MRSRSIGVLLGILAGMFSCGAVARADDGSCWQMIYRAIEHSAAAPHAPYITYRERVHMEMNGRRFERASATITYRDDGYASVDDDRWSHPFISTFLDPGPPVLGPYGGDRRSAWLAFAGSAGALPVIADDRTPARARCIDRGNDVLDGATLAHVQLPDAATDVPALKELWIDRSTHDVARIVVSEWLAFYGETADLTHKLTDFTLDIGRVGPYQVVRRVAWRYRYRVYDQHSTLDAEYLFGDYTFGTNPPAGTLFATRGQ